MTSPIATPPRVSVSTWALHSLLGTVYPGRPGDASTAMMSSSPGTLDLLDVPANLKRLGITTMELCHFHLPIGDAFRAEFAASVRENGIELWSVLLDDGDITHPDTGADAAAWNREWLQVAGAIGARCVRVIAGKQSPTPENIALAAERLRGLSVDGYLCGVRVMTENWFDLLATPGAVAALMHDTNGAVGLCFDFGNWDTHASKYDDLRQIARFAESCHAKASFDAHGALIESDFRQCLDILARAAYGGPYTLVASTEGDVWGGIEKQAAFLRENGYVLDTPQE